MPPIPRPGDSPSADPRRAGRARSSSRSTSSSDGESQRARKTSQGRPTQSGLALLNTKVERMYMIVGTMVAPFGRFVPVLKPLGDNLKSFSEEAAEAWIELAQEDPKVRKALEQLTSASTWGNIVGVHVAIIGSSIPGPMSQYAEAMNSGSSEQRTQPSPEDILRSMGASEEEVEQAMSVASQMMAQGPPMPARDEGTGGPGDTVHVPPPPVFNGNDRTSIPTPEELGAKNPSEPNLFPGDMRPRGNV